MSSGLTGDHLSPDEPAVWQPGDRVTLRGADWKVVQHARWADCETLRLDAVAAARSQTFLLPFDRPHRIKDGRLAVVSVRAWLHAFERLLLDVHPQGGLRHGTSAVDLVPYQLEPALAMLRHGHPRLLVADDVGMGKTIEAGLILRELAGRHDGFRALILVPAGLRQQWIDELAGRFNMLAVAADAGWLRSIGRLLPSDVNPWSPPGTYVASFDFVKRAEALRPLEDLLWDLVVVDEAHAAALATDRRAAIDAIASRARRVVLLTATPPADSLQFAALCRIGLSPGEADIRMLQRGRDSDGRTARRSVVLATRLTEEERRLHRLLERYTTLVWREAGRAGNAQGRLATTVLRKRALSSAASLVLSLRRRQELLAGEGAPHELQLLLPLSEADDDVREEVVSDELLGSPGLSDLASEQRWLSIVLAAAVAAAAQESKARVLVRLLKRIRQPAIVFTEYRDTLEQLRALLLASHIPACVLHGALTTVERREALASFARGRNTLVATDAAAEGLNLQRACRVVVHFELPWNPSRMLQRAGRVDRLGQRRRVHEIALVASDTAESLVLVPLARRATGRLGIGGGGRMLQLLTESRVAEAVFEGLPTDPPAEPVAAAPCVAVHLTGEANLEALRLQNRRTLASRARNTSAKHQRRATSVTVIRRSSLARGVVLIFDLKTAEPNGEMVERSLAAVHVVMTLPPWPQRPRQIGQRLSQFLPGLLRVVSPTLDQLGRRQLDAVRPRFLEAQGRARRRERAILNSRQSAARQLVQAGLFDRRAWRVARQDDAPREACTVPRDASTAIASLLSSASLRAVLVVSGR